MYLACNSTALLTGLIKIISQNCIAILDEKLYINYINIFVIYIFM